MNQENVKQLKAYYESELIKELSSVLGFDASRFAASWNLEQTEVNLNASENNTVSNYRFMYTNSLSITMQSYRLTTNANRQICGMEALTTTIDLGIMQALNDVFTRVLNSEMPAADGAAKEAEVEAE